MALSKGHTFTSGEVVTPTKLNNLVDNATIGDGTITTAMIADDAVTADKIATGAVTSDALASGVGGASAINDLTDVDTSSVAPTDGQALVWDNANSKWEPGTASGGSTVTYLSSPYEILNVADTSSDSNNDTYVTYNIPSSVPTSAGGMILRFQARSHDHDSVGSKVEIFLKTSSYTERRVCYSYSHNNSDDSAADVNTFTVPYSSTIDVKFSGVGEADFAQVYVDGYMTGGSGSGVSKYDSGWVTTDGSTTVANGATLTFTHGLSTSALNAQIWVSGASDGSYPYLMDIQETFSNTSMVGAGITNITSTQITIQFSDSGYVYMNSSGQNATSTVNGHDAASSGYVPFTSKYVRVVAIG